MRIDLHDGFHLSAVCDGDQSAYVAHFLDQDLADHLLRIPYPYAPEDAEFWVRHCTDLESKTGRPNHFAFRRGDGFLIGGIGLQVGSGTRGHRAELGYWLAKDYRGLGLATAGTQAIARFGFGDLGLYRIEATVATHNLRSQQVLEKTGFAREGFLAGYHQKNGKLIDVYLFSILASVARLQPRQCDHAEANR
jgi:ribosomal-protein-alanine N-acetyltransferase